MTPLSSIIGNGQAVEETDSLLENVDVQALFISI